MVNQSTSSGVGHPLLFPSNLARLVSSWMFSSLLTKPGLLRKSTDWLLNSNQNIGSNSKSSGLPGRLVHKEEWVAPFLWLILGTGNNLHLWPTGRINHLALSDNTPLFTLFAYYLSLTLIFLLPNTVLFYSGIDPFLCHSPYYLDVFLQKSKIP